MMTNTYLPHVGGVARSIDTFAMDFRRRHHQVLVVAPKYPGLETVPARVERHVVRLPAIQQFNGSDFSVRLPMSWLVKPRLQQFVPDIVHSHHPYLIGDSALRYAADCNAPVVFTHHTLHEEYTHNVPLNSPVLKQFVIELCTQYANLCDAVIAPSESIACLIQTRGVKVPVQVIPTGIDLKAFARGDGARFRSAHGLPEDVFIVGHVGRLAPEKNLGYLGRTVARFLDQNRNSRFLIIGEGPMAEELHDHFKEQALTERLLMAGKQTGQTLCDAYAAMDVFVFASLTETQGMVLVEAMAAGKPVLALDAAGVREVVRDEFNGFLLEAEANDEEFAEQLQRIHDCSRFRRKFANGALQTARQFSRAESAAKALALYGQVLRQTRRARLQAEEDMLTALIKRIEVERALIQEKASAVLKAFTGEAGRPS